MTFWQRVWATISFMAGYQQTDWDAPANQTFDCRRIHVSKVVDFGQYISNDNSVYNYPLQSVRLYKGAELYKAQFKKVYRRDRDFGIACIWDLYIKRTYALFQICIIDPCVYDIHRGADKHTI